MGLPMPSTSSATTTTSTLCRCWIPLQLLLLTALLVFGCCATEKHVSIADEIKIIETTSGLVRGKSFSTLFQSKQYYAFKGIPYAEPPINSLRFKVNNAFNYTHNYIS